MRQPTTRERILAAAARLLDEAGLARVTTKEIARVAGFSEPTLYKHFRDKEDLLLAVLHDGLPHIDALSGLPERAGTGTVEGNLRDVAEQASGFFDRSIPVGSAIFAERDMLAKQRARLRAAGLGPQLAERIVAEYLRAEQRLGRVSAEVAPEAAAALLVGACFYRAFVRAYMGEGPGFTPDVVTALLHGLTPGPSAGDGDGRMDMSGLG
ncbi:TetR/AcrR family transcriptional regulator [Nonomuraea roseoviolacea subsp. roseoviolacea]|uniref:TetR/AcrR family transcriptional regulator n=1 Tax=Nonomuraea roseoviolacea TaxID=103837 RepID=UPI0031D1CEC2